MSKMSDVVQKAQGLGDTWGKMLTVCIDLAYPKERMGESTCDVGSGAFKPLQALMPKADAKKDKKELLKAFAKIANSSTGSSTKSFWSVLKKVETQVRDKFSKYPLICAQANTRQGNLSAVTLQVQLCEYRQFRHSLARLKYGLPDDETMRVETASETSLKAENYVEADDKARCMKFQFIMDEDK